MYALSRGKQKQTGFYHYNYIEDPHRNYYIYTPIEEGKRAAANLIHEMAHFFFDAMFNEETNPYHANEVRYFQNYKIAAKNTLIEISTKLLNYKGTEAIFNGDEKDIAIFLKNSAPLALNHYISSIKDGIPIEPLYEIEIIKAYYTATYHSHYNMLLTDDIISQWSEGFRQQLLEKAYKLNTWSDDDSYLLERIFDYVRRDVTEYDKELLPRVLELQAAGLNEQTLSVFDPLIQYWKNFITPEVEKMVQEHRDRCTDENRKDEPGWCILELNQESEVASAGEAPHPREYL